MFFTKKQKDIALKKGYFLQYDYEHSEKMLKECAKQGDEKELEKAMSIHHDIEYAYLFTFTPEYRQLIAKSFVK